MCALLQPFDAIYTLDRFTEPTPERSHAYAFIQMDRREDAKVAIRRWIPVNLWGVPCPACGGSGQKVERQQRAAMTLPQITACPTCHGQRMLIDTPCSACGGRGIVEREEQLTVKIPPGAEEGMALRIPGRDEPCATLGAPPGDLYVVVHTAPDSRFQRRGADLWQTTNIAVLDAILGTTLPVATLDGAVAMSIPPGTQPGTVFRLYDKGLPEFDSQRRGLLYLVVQVQIPEKLGPQERELYQRLRVLEGKAK